jgi:hypothetical protein
VPADPYRRAQFDDAAIEAVLQLAARRLAAVAPHIHILVVWPKPAAEIAPRSSGWCEIGRLADVFNHCWWTILWHPERGEGRLLRSYPRRKRGPLGEIIERP